MSHYKGKGKSKRKKEAQPKSPSNSHYRAVKGRRRGEWLGGGARRGEAGPRAETRLLFMKTNTPHYGNCTCE